MKEIIKPLILLIVITFISTVILHYLTPLPIWLIVIFCIILQFIGNYILQSILVTYYSVKTKNAEAEMLTQLSFQTAAIECPCHKHNKQEILLRLNDNTTYKCNACGKELGVTVDISSALLTQPVDTTVDGFEKLLKEAKNVAEDTTKSN